MENLELTRATAASFWRGKRVVLTGHTGFKGGWLAIWLHRLGADVTGIGLPPAATPNLFAEANISALCRGHFCDIRDATALRKLIHGARAQIVFHLAAQPLVRESYREPRATFETNIMGTANVLDALRGETDARVAIMVTTDKVYRDSGRKLPYREDHPLGGHDPYSASKAASELVIASYRDAFLSAQNIAVASARAGNVIGGGDWSPDRLIPDAMRAWEARRALDVRRPQAVRPWQHVLEPLAGYLALARALWERPALAGAYNFGPSPGDAISVRDLVEFARRAYGESEVRYADSNDGPHESDWLALDSTRARTVLGLLPAKTTQQAVARTMAWYRAHRQGRDARQLCDADISGFTARELEAAS
jgi:CDP-glucose 4,6-dehydratase